MARRLSAALLVLMSLLVPALSQHPPQCNTTTALSAPQPLQTSVNQLFSDGDPSMLKIATDLQQGSLTATNTGRTLRVTLKSSTGQPGFELDGSSSPVPISGRYVLENMHLHWSDVAGERGSVHQIDGQFAEAEAHFVFIKKEYGSLTESLKQADGVVVVALLLETGLQSAGALPMLGLDGDVAQLKLPGCSITRQADLRPLEPLLRSAVQSFFSYEGKLSTTDACAPLVRWMVPDQRFSVEESFLQGLRSGLYADAAGTKLIQETWRDLESLGRHEPPRADGTNLSPQQPQCSDGAAAAALQ